MKHYPHIEYWNQCKFGETVWGFEKLDGSNIRAEWSKKRGFYKFGTKQQMIDEKHPQFGKAVTLFLNKYDEGLSRIFTDKKEYREMRNFVVFCEYFGEKSFAGYHETDDIMDIVLFDVSMFQKGWVKPKDFIDNFNHLGIPRLIYYGNFNRSLINDVREGKFDVKEGIMAKGLRRTKGDELVWMTKIKTQAWFDKLRRKLGDKYLLKEVNYDKELLLR
jgi:hypothetical protein